MVGWPHYSSIEEDYARLITDYTVENNSLFTDVNDERWEQWWVALEQLAVEDGLRLIRGSNGYGAGSYWMPTIEIARPGGERYWAITERWEMDPPWAEVVSAIEGDWGAALAAARVRRGFESHEAPSHDDAGRARIVALVDASFPAGVAGTAQHMFCGILV